MVLFGVDMAARNATTRNMAASNALVRDGAASAALACDMAASNLTSTDPPQAVTSGPVEQLVVDFLAGRRKTTLKTYSQALRDFAQFVGVETVAQAAGTLLAHRPGLGNQLVYRYRAQLLERGMSTATCNIRLSALRSLVKLARIIGIVTWGLEVPNLKAEGYRDTRGPGTDGVRQLLSRAGAHRSPAHAARDVAMLRLMFDLGLRRGSVVTLDVEHVDLASRRIWVMLKGHTQRTLRTLPQETCGALRTWLRHRGEEAGPLFINFDRAGKGQRLTGRSLHRIVQRLGQDLGIVARPHGLRHSAITEALELMGGDVRAVQKFANHADIRVIERYDDNRQDVAGQVARRVAERV
jgi:integrase/recombinase XerC